MEVVAQIQYQNILYGSSLKNHKEVVDVTDRGA